MACRLNAASRGFDEFKIVPPYDDGGEHRLASVRRGDCHKAGERRRPEAGRVGLDKAGDKVALVAGAEWLRKQLRQQGSPLGDTGLDFYHLAGNVHEARRAVYGEEDPKGGKAPGNAWAAEVLHRAKQESYVKLEEAAWEWAFRRRGAKRKAAPGRLSYPSQRDDMIRYQELIEAGR